MSVRFGSQADVFPDITPTAASGDKAANRREEFDCRSLNVCFYRKRPFRSVDSRDIDRQLTATSRLSCRLDNIDGHR